MRFIWLLVIGLSIGLLVGLSVSPVIEGAVTALVAFAGAAVGALAGFESRHVQEKDGKVEDAKATVHERNIKVVDPAPMALFMIGLITGSFIGIKIRTSDVLGVDVPAIIQKWSAEGVGLDKKAIAERVFNVTYPSVAAAETKNPKVSGSTEPTPAKAANELAVKKLSGVLFGEERPAPKAYAECSALLTKINFEELKREILSLPDGPIKRMALQLKSADDVTALIGAVCSSGHQE